MDESKEKNEEVQLVADGVSVAESAKNGADKSLSEAPKKVVRMKWGKVIEEPEEETPLEAREPSEIVAKPAEAPPPPPSKPDPLVEAVRRAMQSRERTEQSDVPSETDGSGSSEGNAPTLNAIPPTKGAEPRPEEGEPPRRETSAADIRAARAAEEARRQLAEAERRRIEEENLRLKRELERDELRRTLRKKRRKDGVRRFFGGLFGGLVAAFRGIRISKKWIVALVLTVVLALVAAVILGNLLRDRIPQDDEIGSDSVLAETTEEPITYARDLEIPKQSAGIVSLEGATARSLRSAASRFAASDVSGVSLILRDETGALLFDAKTSDALGIDTAEADLLSISEILEPFRAQSLYISCVLPMRYFMDGDDYSRSVLYAYETALLCEIAEAGADEVILLDADALFTAEDAEENSAKEASDELRRIAKAVNERSPETAVGIALTPEFLDSRESDRYLSEIVSAFDLALLDLRALDGESLEAYTDVGDAVSSHLYFILRYSMRILIPAGSAEAVMEREVYDWQEGTIPSADETVAAG